MENLKVKTELTKEQELTMEEIFGETREEIIESLKRAEEEIERGEGVELHEFFRKLRE